jgi:glycosyltransferase involved in cell wall biosynthesis
MGVLPRLSNESSGYLDVAGQIQSETLDVTIVLPCLNEAETLATCIRKALRGIRDSGLNGEVVIADNGSEDGSQDIAVSEGARLVHVPVRGYGAALMAGIKSAKGKFVLMADADDSYHFSHLPRFIAALDAGCDLVMGNRFKGEIEPGAMPFLHKYLGNPVLTWLGRLFFRVPVGDFHCGIRAFRKSAIESLNLSTTGMEFASEMVVKASLAGLKIVDVPTTLSRDGRSRAPHLRTWRDGWRHLRFLLLYSPRWLFLYPGALLMLFGALVSAWLLPGQRAAGHLNLDVDTLAYASACILIGFHACTFAISAKVFAISEGLLPPDAKFVRWFRYVNLETGLGVGVACLLAGVALGAYDGWLWSRTGFGALHPSQALRLTLPSATAIILGIEIIFTSFFLSLLGLKRR